MDNLQQFKIDLKGMKGLEEAFDFDLDGNFFQHIGGEEVKDGSLHTHLDIAQKSDEFELRFLTKGTVTVACNLCLEDMTLPIDTCNTIVVKMGENLEDDGDTITIPAEQGIIDVAWLIYEFVALEIPIRHVHEPGECNAEMTEKIKQLSARQAGEGEEAQQTDPRWKELEKLKTIFKD